MYQFDYCIGLLSGLSMFIACTSDLVEIINVDEEGKPSKNK